MSEVFAESEHADIVRDHKGRFVSGTKAGPGRKLGNRNRHSENFLAAMADDFEKHGADVIAKVRTEEPAKYLQIAADLLPRHAQLDVTMDYAGAQSVDDVLRLMRDDFGEAAVLLVQQILDAEPDAPKVIEHKPQSDVAASLKALRK